MKWSGVYSVAIELKPKKGGRVCSNTEAISERMDTGVGGSNNAQALSAALTHKCIYVGEGGQSATQVYHKSVVNNLESLMNSFVDLKRRASAI